MSTQAMSRSTTKYVVRDSVTMLRRNLRHWIRYPSLAIMLVAQPIVLLLLIDLADRVLVVKPGAYVGASTSKDIAYAHATGKPISYTDLV